MWVTVGICSALLNWGKMQMLWGMYVHFMHVVVVQRMLVVLSMDAVGREGGEG